tara:strand:+ start:1085 stop:2089 length:1005 start_codon:yes stop_codon:yes gene_type:complete
MAELPNKISHIQVNAFGADSEELSQSGHYTYQYTSKNPVSLTMKNQQATYNHGVLRPIFSQNLPEGYVRRYISEKLRRHANVNDMYLLALQLDKSVGHLSYTSGIEKTDVGQLSLNDILNWQGKENLFHQLLDRYYLNGLVSGVQPKMLVNAVNDTGKPSIGRNVLQQEDFIIKTYDDEFPLFTVNEYVCMEADRACAKLMVGDDGFDCAMLEFGGWDTHNNQSNRLEQKLVELDNGLAELKAGFGKEWQNTVVLIGTEFGRTAKENGTGGTDHGTGSALILAGGAVSGGKVQGRWPRLKVDELFEQRDLMPTLTVLAGLSVCYHSIGNLVNKG